MSKNYYVEVKVSGKWILKERCTRQVDALHSVKINAGEKYPMRIVKVIRTVIFDGEK